jgi:hypothetical protein
MRNLKQLTTEQLNEIISFIENKRKMALKYSFKDFKYGEDGHHIMIEPDSLNLGIFQLIIKNYKIDITANDLSRIDEKYNGWCYVRVMLYWNYIDGGDNGTEIVSLYINSDLIIREYL